MNTKENLPSKVGQTVAVFIFVALAFVGGYYFGGREVQSNSIPGLTNVSTGQPTNVDFGQFWEVWNLVDEKFVNGTSTKDKAVIKERVYGAIGGMVGALDDPYTVFMPPEEEKYFAEEISGNFGGVGMEIGVKDDVLTVIAPLPDTPAMKAGIKAGDKIIAIEGKSTSGVATDEAVRLIRGEAGTAVVITVDRGGVKSDFKLVRANISVPTIETEIIDGNVFVIRLYNFSAVSPNKFREALREFVVAKTPNLILDLRGNPGGYLEAAVDVSSWFIPQGKAIVNEHYSSGKENVYRSKGYNAFNDNLRMVVLVDQGSASASEIVAGALSEYKIAVLVGGQTFGKGSVQELINLDDGALKLTIAKWLTPLGKSISGNGLTPDVEVEMDENDLTADPQLDKAVEILKNTTNLKSLMK